MKHKNIFRMLAVALTLALLLVAIPASPAMALAVSVTVNPNAGTIGDPLNISGTGGEGTSYDLYFSSQSAAINDQIDDEVTAYEYLTSVIAGGITGSFSTVGLKVPANLTDGDDDEAVHGGTYYIYMTRAGLLIILAKTTFTVVGVAKITTFDPDEGVVGTEVEIGGEGFAPGEAIIVEYDGDELEIDSGDEETGSDGKFELTIIIPESTYGEHTITVKGEDSLAELDIEFFVLPEININPVSGETGTLVTVTGTGFDRRNGVDFKFGVNPITVVWLVESTGRTNSDGTFAVNMVVPAVAPGNYTVLAEDEDDDDISAQRTFNVIVVIPPLNPAITVNPTSGNVGDEVTVSGTEFGNNKPITLYLDNVVITPKAPITTGSTGSFSGIFVIPAIAGGSHAIKAEDTEDHSKTTTITVEPEMSMAPLTGVMGDEIDVSGTGFGANKTINIMYGTIAIAPTAEIKTDPKGNFSGSFLVPAIPGGSRILTVKDDTNSLTATFIMKASVIINPTSGIIGSGVGVGGYGFGANKTITILFNNTPVTLIAPVITDANGICSNAQFYVPASTAGTATITVSDGTTSINTSFTVLAATASITPTTGGTGTEVTVSGTNFAASSTVTIKYYMATDSTTGDFEEFTTTVTSAGVLSTTFDVPVSTGGDHIITVSDGVNTKQFTFTVETTPPLAPTPMLIFVGNRAEQPVAFDWADVTDDSIPVTYNLQVATDANFTDIVVNKASLTESKYTLTEAEKLEPVSKKTPYYWHVNAVDSAGNISAWSGADSFYIGGGWPGWLTWLLIGLGILTGFLFALWLGRRVAFSSY